MDAAKRDLSDAAFSLRGFNTRGNALQAPDGDGTPLQTLGMRVAQTPG